MINVAVIGAGSISNSHIKAYQTFPERCRIIAVADMDLERAQQQVEKHQLEAEAVADYKELLKDRDIQLASICTPPGSHPEIACALLEAGINTICEKPMASSLAECDVMLAAAERTGALLSVVAQRRFQTPWMRLKGLLDSGLAGKLLHAQVDSFWWRGHSYYDLWWRGTWESEGGGVTLNHAVHHIDALLWMAGMPTEVQAMMANVAHDNAEVEDLSVAVLRFESGALGQVTSSVVHHGQEQLLAFQTEKARLTAPWDIYASTSRPNGFPDRDLDDEARLTAYYAGLPESRYEGHAGQVDDVLRAIESGSRKILIDGYEGRKTVEVITAIYESAIIGKPVMLPLQPDDPFVTKEGLLAAAPRFHEKSAAVARFADR